MDNRRQVEALRAANRGMARAVCQGAKTAKRYAALGAGMEVDAQGYGREPTAMVRGVLSCLFVCLFLTLFTRNGVFWDACWSWLGARPRTALWQTGGNGTHAVRSAVGRAVGRTAGQDCGTGGRPTGYSLCKGSIPLGGSPRLLSVARALLPKRVFYLEGGGRKPGQWERARARVRQTWGFFMDVYSGEAYGRRVRALQGETSLQVFR